MLTKEVNKHILGYGSVITLYNIVLV